ncbi:MAG: DUF4198 domain-containing protein [Treponema sp.]
MNPIKKLFVLLLSIIASTAYAHFQLIYTPLSIIPQEQSSVEFQLAFTHPFESGLTMDIGKDESGTIKGLQAFFALHKGKKTDLLPTLSEIQFTSSENSGKGFALVLDKNTGFRGGGDWVLVAVPHPYYEKSDDMYIQQITKVMINKGGLDTDWAKRAAEGYPEILPLVKPYDVWEGGLFRGIVVDEKGRPVPKAKIEFVYLNYAIDMQTHAFTGSAKLKKSGAGVILANDQGLFEFIPPRAGYWGFAALEAGGSKQFGGKALSEEAVLWIEAQPRDPLPIQKPVQEAASKAAPQQAKSGNASSGTLAIIVIVIIGALGILIIRTLKKKKN